MVDAGRVDILKCVMGAKVILFIIKWLRQSGSDVIWEIQGQWVK